MSKFDNEIRLAAMACAERPTKSTAHMSLDEREAGIGQMLRDLHRLATEDGCIAAAWAFEYLMLPELTEEELEILNERCGDDLVSRLWDESQTTDELVRRVREYSVKCPTFAEGAGFTELLAKLPEA